MVFSINCEFNEESHVYTVDGNPVPSVTEIVGMIDFGNLAKINPAVLEHAALRGTIVHEYCEAIDNGYDPEDLDIEPELVPYVQAYLAFLRDYRPVWELVEQPLYCPTFAGTLDRFGTIDRNKAIVDIKTAASADRHSKLKWQMQLSGYEELLWRNEILTPLDETDYYILQLKKDATYTLHKMNKDSGSAYLLFYNLLDAATEYRRLITKGNDNGNNETD